MTFLKVLIRIVFAQGGGGQNANRGDVNRGDGERGQGYRKLWQAVTKVCFNFVFMQIE